MIRKKTFWREKGYNKNFIYKKTRLPHCTLGIRSSYIDGRCQANREKFFLINRYEAFVLRFFCKQGSWHPVEITVQCELL